MPPGKAVGIGAGDAMDHGPAVAAKVEVEDNGLRAPAEQVVGHTSPGHQERQSSDRS